MNSSSLNKRILIVPFYILLFFFFSRLAFSLSPFFLSFLPISPTFSPLSSIEALSGAAAAWHGSCSGGADGVDLLVEGLTM